VVRTIRKAQQLKVDFLGFARIIHQEDPELWRRIQRNWQQEFPRIRSEVRFQININSFGITKDSILNERSGRNDGIIDPVSRPNWHL
jgi:spore germination protein KC